MKVLIAFLGMFLSIVSHAAAQATATEISTVVMDGVGGKSAVGMTVELYAVSTDKPRLVARAETAGDGRAFLVKGGPLPLETYELHFQLADYFARQGIATGEPPVFDYVKVRFSVTDPAGHYHVPLICTPSQYTTYRGS